MANTYMAGWLKIWIKKVIRKVFCLTPRNKHLWVFGSRGGLRYDENSKYLFEYVHQHEPDIQAVWITRDTRIRDALRQRGLRVHLADSLAGWWFVATSGVAIVSISLNDIHRFTAIIGAKIIQLWHGTPMKTTDLGGLGERYDMVIVAGAEYLTNGMLGDPLIHPFVLTGYPKNDHFFQSDPIRHMERLKADYGAKRLVLYLPTYRNKLERSFNTDLFHDYGFDIKKLECLMRKYEVLFIFKLHPLNILDNPELIKQIQASRSLHLVDADDPFVDVYEFLKYTDVLITDYSSVYFDFLLLDRPVIFASFDYESYTAERPLNFSYDAIAAGPEARDWPALHESLQEILSGKDKWKNERVVVNKRFNYYRDNRSCERVYKEIRSVLNI